MALALFHQEAFYQINELDGLDAGMGGFDPEVYPIDISDSVSSLSGYSVRDLHAGSYNSESDVTRRSSTSTFSMSSTEPIAECTEPFAFCEEPLQVANFATRGSNYSTAITASPVQVPQQYRARAGSHSRAPPSFRPNFRTAPYSYDGITAKPWSSVACAAVPARHTSPQSSTLWEGSGGQVSSIDSYHSSPVMPIPNDLFGDGQLGQPQAVDASTSSFLQDSTVLAAQYEGSGPESQLPPSFSSHDLLHIFHSSLDSQNPRQNHYSYCSHPPDLFAPLLDDQESLPPEDRNPSDPDLIPREQDVRFEGDLYTPRWVRGHGNKREGWCGICKPGRWLVLKNSAFWYDKSFSHGVSAATGIAFEGPTQTRRVDGNPDVWEGLCTSCGEWIALISSKKKGTTWFRHAYKVCIYLNGRALLVKLILS